MCTTMNEFLGAGEVCASVNSENKAEPNIAIKRKKID